MIEVKVSFIVSSLAPFLFIACSKELKSIDCEGWVGVVGVVGVVVDEPLPPLPGLDELPPELDVPSLGIELLTLLSEPIVLT